MQDTENRHFERRLVLWLSMYLSAPGAVYRYNREFPRRATSNPTEWTHCFVGISGQFPPCLCGRRQTSLDPVKDPLRIPRVLEALSAAWEAQPDLTLPQLYGVLESRGVAWNSTDDEVLDALDALVADVPSRVDAEAPGRYLVETEQPAHRVTLDPWWAAVRPVSGRGSGPAQPTVWRHGAIRRCMVGQPLTVLDADGAVHRFGLVGRISVLADTVDAPTTVTTLTGLRHSDLDGHVYHLQLDGDDHAGTSVLVDRSLWVFDVSRRELHRDRVRWTRLARAEVGEELVVEQQGGAPVRLPVLCRITLLE